MIGHVVYNCTLRLPKKKPRFNTLPIILSLLLLTVFQTLLIYDVSAPPTTRIVPSASYPTIQSAIDASKRGDIVQVNPGTYYEHLLVNVANLLLRGTNKYTTIIDGDAAGTPVTLEASGITVTGFTITDQGTKDYGIKSYTYGGHNITDNIVQNMSEGIYFSQSDSNIIRGNTFFNNNMRAINVASSQSNQITDNIISDSAYGIYLRYSDNTQVLRNSISRTSFGILSGEATQNNISNNTMQSNSCGIQTYYSDHFTINNNAITGGMYGIQLQRTSYSTLANNTLTQPQGYCMYFAYSSYNTFGGTRGNLVTKSDWGICISNSTGNQIIDGNIIAENTWGIFIINNANGNTIYHNNFYSNVKHVYQDTDSFQNTWWNGVPEGSYWNDYSGYGPAGGVDYYPLTQPWPMRNLAITSVTPSKTQFYPGEAVTVQVNVKNFGVITEVARVTAYYSTNIIGTKTTTLTQNAAQLLTFNWNTLNVPVGNHVISARVEPIPYVERDYTDNTLNDGTVQVGLQGDINGDHVVNNQDLILLKQAYGAVPGAPNWNQNADLNYDLLIDAIDLDLLGKNYGKTA